MSLQHFGKGALRVAKNYTKGYSEVQSKVRDATSNDPWGPSGTQMNEIAQMTYNQQDFVEIMEMIDKRLNDKGKNWRHVFKALTVLDYLLHAGSENVVLYFRDNLYVIKTLKEFQYIDEDMKDQGANVRQKAKDITNLLQDESRLRDQRRSRAFMENRMRNGEPGEGGNDDEDENARRRSERSPPPRTTAPRRTKKEDEDLNKALALSRQSMADEEARKGRLTAEERDLEEALKRSKDEEAARLKALEDSNSRALFDEGTQLNANSGNPFPLIDASLGPQHAGLQPQFTANPFWQQQQAAAQQQAEYEWMMQQQQQQAQQQAAMQQQAQQEEWMRQQAMLQQQQQQAQQQAFFQQQQQTGLFAPQQQIQAQPTGYGSNNPFALAAGTAQLGSPQPNFGSSPSPNFGMSSPQQQQQPQSQPQFNFQPTTQQQPSYGNGGGAGAGATPSPKPPASPTMTNTQLNARRPAAIDDGQHAQLNSLFANRDDGLDSFGNTGTLRYGQQAGRLVGQSTGAGGTNPFAKQQQQNEQPFFSI